MPGKRRTAAGASQTKGRRQMNGTTSVVRIGASGARILAVTDEGIDYLDEAGRQRSIDLAECARNWGRWRNARSQEFRPLPGLPRSALPPGTPGASVGAAPSTIPRGSNS